MRQIVLDTETTGLEPEEGHRIIEIGCVELVNRRLTGNNYHQYIQPDREIDAGAIEVHGITNESLADKPRFHDIASDFIEYIKGAELIIHNAPFDTGFLDNEFRLMADREGVVTTAELCSVTDTLKMARAMHPGQKNNLDALCKRYEIDNSQRTFHGALLDAEILAEVYLSMTGGQTGFFEDRAGHGGASQGEEQIRRLPAERERTRVIQATAAELAAHEEWLEQLDKAAEGQCLWKKIELTQN